MTNLLNIDATALNLIPQILVLDAFAYRTEDSFEHGQIEGDDNYAFVQESLNATYPTMAEFKQAMKNRYGLDDVEDADWAVEILHVGPNAEASPTDFALRAQRKEDRRRNVVKPDSDKYKQWKDGETRLWDAEFRFRFRVIFSLQTSEDAVEALAGKINAEVL